jgi:energy-coupling factor transport system ATP-binding protein
MGDLLAHDPIQAMLFATHDLDLARAYANRVIIMDDGAIVADGDPETILSDTALLRRCRLC